MESTLCPICNSNTFKVSQIDSQVTITSVGTKRYPIITVLCKNCGHVYSNPRMDQEELQNYYEFYYGEDFGGTTPASPRAVLYDADINWIKSQIRKVKGKKLLEIGSYMGNMLIEFQKQGWEVHGIEPTTTAATIAKEEFGLSIDNCFFEDVQVPEKEEDKYDLVVMGAVLEHISDPTSTLLRINQFLKSSGHLFIRVPNVEKLILDSVGTIFTIEHPNMFSQDALRMLYKKTGFNEVAETTHENWHRQIISLAQKTENTSAALDFDLVTGLYEKVDEHLTWYNNFLQDNRRSINSKLEHLWYPNKKSVIIYGAGNHTDFLLNHTSISKANIIGLSDSNQAKWDHELFSYIVYPPNKIAELKPDAVIISSRACQDDIYKSISYLEEMGIEIVKLYDIESLGIMG